jgi:hypothetical protein
MPNSPVNPRIKNLLLTMIVFFKHKATEKDLKPVITIAKLIDMLRGSGFHLSYQQLVDMTKDPTIAPSIKSINKNQIEFNLGDESATEPSVADVMPQEQQPAQGDEEEYNPDDFAMPEGEEGTPEEGEPQPFQQEPQRPQQSIIHQMATRAMNRAD